MNLLINLELSEISLRGIRNLSKTLYLLHIVYENNYPMVPEPKLKPKNVVFQSLSLSISIFLCSPPPCIPPSLPHLQFFQQKSALRSRLTLELKSPVWRLEIKTRQRLPLRKWCRSLDKCQGLLRKRIHWQDWMWGAEVNLEHSRIHVQNLVM